MEFYAHTPNGQNNWHNLIEHLRGVAQKAEGFGAGFEAAKIAYYLGLWHDIGKFGKPFQDYLRECEANKTNLNFKGRKVDHKGAGTQLSFQHLKVFSLIIQGHHGGLRDISKLKGWLAEKTLDPNTLEAISLASQQMPDLLPNSPVTFPTYINQDKLALELYLRMVFSAVVDADFLDTEEHFSEDKAAIRGSSITLQTLWDKFEAAQKQISKPGDTLVNQARYQIYQACLTSGELPQGLFKLTVPTGGGKTRSGLGFALKHAIKHNLKRIIVAVPFTTITEQTANEYRKIFETTTDENQPPIVLEHHSAYALEEGGTEYLENGDFRQKAVWNRLSAENWDAPLIVTTTVQLLESLFAASTSKCRKLHRLAESVIILDEAQSLPPALLSTILNGLTELATHYRTTIVLSTATQPAFSTIKEFNQLVAQEIVPDPALFFQILKRVEYDPRLEQELEWTQVVELMQDERAALAIVNTKKDALALFKALNNREAFYLSTDLCGQHRRKAIEEIKQRLKNGQPCLVVSTQVVEAGVDLDFPLVLRALAPLDGIIQAAGRCNREGKLPTLGRVIIFKPKEGKLPGGAYNRGTNITSSLYAANKNLDCNDPVAATEYFRQLYNEENLDLKKIKPLREKFDYPEVAEKFKMIPDDTQNVVVLYGTEEEKDLIEDKLKKLQAGVPYARKLLRQLQPYIVAVRKTRIKEYTNQNYITEVIPGLGKWLGNYHERYGLAAEAPSPENWTLKD